MCYFRDTGSTQRGCACSRLPISVNTSLTFSPIFALVSKNKREFSVAKARASSAATWRTGLPCSMSSSSTNQPYRPKRPSVLRQRISSGSSTSTITRATFIKPSSSNNARWRYRNNTIEQEYDLAKRRLYRELDGDDRLARMLGHASLLDSIEDKVNRGEVELFEKLSNCSYSCLLELTR